MNNDNRRMQDVSTVFDNTWKANNFSHNGMKDKIDSRNDHFNKMFNIKSREEQKKEILHSHSVKGQVESLNQSMQGLNNINRNRF